MPPADVPDRPESAYDLDASPETAPALPRDVDAGSDAGPFARLGDRYATLPRIGKWIVWAVLFAAAFLLYDWGRKEHAALAEQIATREQAIEEFGATELAEMQARVTRARERWGAVSIHEGDRSSDLSQEVARIMERYDVRPRQTDTGTSDVRLPGGGSATLQGRKLQKRGIDLKFQAPPDVVLSIIADLEQAEYVTRLESVELKRQVREAELEVTVKPEVWFIPGSN